MTDVVGTGTVNGDGDALNGPLVATSDFDFTADVVSEPATVGLLGLARLGVGAATRRRKSA